MGLHVSIDHREYQQTARHQINAELNAGRSPILANPTGTGKTTIGVQVISDRVSLGCRVFVLVPSEEVFGQWIAALTNAGLEPGYINDEGMKGRNRSVYVCMPISLANILHNIPESLYPEELVIDEAHHTAADTWETIRSFFKNPPCLGLTATPRRTDGKPLDMFDSIIETIDIPEAVEYGFLAEPLVIVPEEWQKKIGIPLEDLDTDAGLEKQAVLLGDPVIIGDMIHSYESIFHGLPVLVACPTYEDANRVTEQFRERGWKWEHIHSKLPKSERKRMTNGIAKGTINGLCTVGIGIEGWDIAGLYGLFWRRRTKSIIINRQFNGRVLRPMKGKRYGIILDFVGNTFIHGMPDRKIHWTLTGTIDDDAPIQDGSPTMKICPRCGVANASDNLTCHMCGLDFQSDEAHESRRRELPTVIDGNLVAVTSDGMARRVSEMIDEAKQSADEVLDKKAEPVRLSKNERTEYLAGGLFAGTMKRKAFNEALDAWRR